MTLNDRNQARIARPKHMGGKQISEEAKC